MSGELDLVRAFRAEDGAVDASSEEQARTALLERIAGSAGGEADARSRWSYPKGVVVRIRADVVAIALATLVVVGVGAAFLSVGTNRQPRPAHAVAGPHGPPVIQNFSPRRPPALPGRAVCTAELTRPAVAPGGLFWPSVCQSPRQGPGGSVQPPSPVGSPSGTFHGSASKVNGLNEYRFSITASGLVPNTGGNAYAVWLLQATPRNGTAGTFRLLEPQRPQLLGVIEPGVDRDGHLAAEGSVPRNLLGDDDLLLITLQPHRTAATPGRTVLRGFVSLSNADS
jgi:hypothetical protein